MSFKSPPWAGRSRNRSGVPDPVSVPGRPANLIFTLLAFLLFAGVLTYVVMVVLIYGVAVYCQDVHPICVGHVLNFGGCCK